MVHVWTPSGCGCNFNLSSLEEGVHTSAKAGIQSKAASHIGNDQEQSAEMCRETIAFTESTSNDRMGGAIAHRSMAGVMLFDGIYDLAEQHIGDAIRFQQAMGNAPEAARSYLLYARIKLAMGDGEMAQEQWDRATRLFTELDMQWDLQQAGSDLSSLQS